ncbi:MAG: signal peptidase I [Candidatus Krumholzibacteria bacterium]|jgi:signal peptidase I|nr:signal peptidase I [Candidatus Krumholzibacteria bacterium]
MNETRTSRRSRDGDQTRRPDQATSPIVKTERSWRGTALDWLKAIAWALAVALLIRQFFFQAFRIPTGSMKETLQIHDYLFANKFLYGAKTPDRLVIPLLNKTLIDGLPQLRLPAIRQPRQGDIIVFEFPEDRNQDYIKRCVAVAGDTVLVRDGILTVNGSIYESNFAVYGGDHSCVPHWREPGRCPPPHSLLDPVSYQRGIYNRQFGPYVVPAGHLFMMGDNRYNSMDSRYWGPLPRELIKGKAEIIYWSFENTFFIPRWERLLLLIDLPPGRAWIQTVVRIAVLSLIAGGIVFYRRRSRA